MYYISQARVSTSSTSIGEGKEKKLENKAKQEEKHGEEENREARAFRTVKSQLDTYDFFIIYNRFD
jgi:hypothetical protein